MAKKPRTKPGNGKGEDFKDEGGDEQKRRARTTAANDSDEDEDDDDKRLGHNEPFEPDGNTLDEFLSLVAEQDDLIEKEQEALRLKSEPFKERIKGHKKKIAEARDVLVDDGMPTKELNTLTMQFRLRRKADRATKELDDTQKERHAAMEKAWKDFSGIPGGLGEAASRRDAAAARQ